MHDYVRFSRGMFDKTAYTMTTLNNAAIKNKGWSTIEMSEFLDKKVGNVDTSMGLVNPGSNIIALSS